MIVVDASAALSALLNDGPARQALAGEQLHSPHLVDSEVANGLRRMVAAQQVSADDGWITLDRWRRLGVTRYAAVGFLDRVWELRDNLSAYDASYVALAELLSCPLLTADARLSRAPGIRCAVTVVPR
jgi:predicted nucleic acid-binding protein